LIDIHVLNRPYDSSDVVVFDVIDPIYTLYYQCWEQFKSSDL